MRALGACGLLLLLAGSAAAREPLGKLEQQALDDALELRGLTLEPAPEGKTIGQIQVVNQDVFSKRDWHFQLLNIFHRTTREHLIRREALFRPGQPYRQDLVDETTRNLQDPDLSSVVVIVPVRSTVPGTVDVLIVTRDVWSLRLNTDFEFENSSFEFWQAYLERFTGSLSENNFLGWRKQVALVFVMDQGEMQVGPTYIDRNISGTRMTFTGSARAIFAREDGRPEGSNSSLVLNYPLYSLASKWGAGVGVGHNDNVFRSFRERSLRTVDLAITPTSNDRLPYLFRQRSFSADAHVTRSFQAALIHRVTLGYAFSDYRASFTGDFPDDPVFRAAFANAFFPPAERDSYVYTSYAFFQPRYVVYRDLDTFDLRENRRLGPSASASVSRIAKVLGSDHDFFSVSGAAGWNLAIADGFQSISASWAGRITADSVINQTYSAGAYAASPVLWRTVRVLGQASATVYVDDTHNRSLSLGGDTGLRGYAIGDLFAKGNAASAIGHLEVRSMAVSVASFRLGGLVFYDVGDAAAPDQGTGWGLVRAIRAVGRLHPHEDVGLGARILIPQLNAYVLRLDWAVPLDSTQLTPAGLPGRFSLGFFQTF